MTRTSERRTVSRVSSEPRSSRSSATSRKLSLYRRRYGTASVAPIDASSGITIRHRLNRGGDRSANQALWRIVMVRVASEPRTRAYVVRRTTEGRSKREIIRALKRYVARELYRCLPRVQQPA